VALASGADDINGLDVPESVAPTHQGRSGGVRELMVPGLRFSGRDPRS